MIFIRSPNVATFVFTSKSINSQRHHFKIFCAPNIWSFADSCFQNQSRWLTSISFLTTAMEPLLAIGENSRNTIQQPFRACINSGPTSPCRALSLDAIASRQSSKNQSIASEEDFTIFCCHKKISFDFNQNDSCKGFQKQAIIKRFLDLLLEKS